MTPILAYLYLHIHYVSLVSVNLILHVMLPAFLSTKLLPSSSQ